MPINRKNENPDQLELFDTGDLPGNALPGKFRKLDDDQLNRLFIANDFYGSPLDLKHIIEFVAKNKNYSRKNLLNAGLQNPNAIYLMTYRAWQDPPYKRKVKPNSRPIMILSAGRTMQRVYDLSDTVGEESIKNLQNSIKEKQFSRKLTLEVCEGIIRNCQNSNGRFNIVYDDEQILEDTNAFGKGNETYNIYLRKHSSLEDNYWQIVIELASIFWGHRGRKSRQDFWPDRNDIDELYKQIEIHCVAHFMSTIYSVEKSPSAGFLEKLHESKKFDKIPIAFDAFLLIVERMGGIHNHPIRFYD